MERFDKSRPLPAAWRGGLGAIGSFDGLHRGHMAILADLHSRAQTAGQPALLVSFEPHPRRYFQPDAAPFRLTTPDERAQILEKSGLVDAVVAIPFDADLATMSAADFVSEWLIRHLGLAGLTIGPDFRFGRDRAGDAAQLQADSRLITHVHPPVLAPDGNRYSSTAVRSALAAGDCAKVTSMLGRPHAICDLVVEGDKRGRLLGFPTANILLGERLVPKLGVYAGHATLADGAIWPCVSNLGVRPTFNGAAPRLESHLIGFDGDLYGQKIAVTLEYFLRPEMKFDGLDALKAQIAIDRDQALVHVAA